MLKDGDKNYAVSADPSKLKQLDYKKNCQYCLEWKNGKFIDYKGGITLFNQGVIGSEEAAQEYCNIYPNFYLI